MTNPLDAIAAEMKAAAFVATPGPWTVSSKVARLDRKRFLVIVSPERWVAHVWEECLLSEEDAAHIAASNPANVLAILDDRDALRALLAKADEALAVATSDTFGELCAEIKKALDPILTAKNSETSSR